MKSAFAVIAKGALISRSMNVAYARITLKICDEDFH